MAIRSRSSVVVALAFGASVFAGCSDDSSPGDGGDLAPGSGVVHGVVVDAVIRPLGGVDLFLFVGASNLTTRSGADGRFAFDDVAAGTHTLRAQHLLYQTVQTTVDVKAGDADPPLTNLQMQRLFEQEAFHETQKFDGFIQCGYDITVASSVCVNDYTHFVGPYTCPQCEYIFDHRGTNFPVGAGWQTLVFEMTWDPSAQGTSDRMRLVVSHFPRPASHWYCSGSSPDPLLVRMEVGEVCEDQQDEPELAPAEGEANMTLFAATDAPEGEFVAATFSQSFTVFMNFFYYGKPQADWSFIRGDEFPF